MNAMQILEEIAPLAAICSMALNAHQYHAIKALHKERLKLLEDLNGYLSRRVPPTPEAPTDFWGGRRP